MYLPPVSRSMSVPPKLVTLKNDKHSKLLLSGVHVGDIVNRMYYAFLFQTDFIAVCRVT
jgi:hypothetical protein